MQILKILSGSQYRQISEIEARIFFEQTPDLSHYVGLINPPRPGVAECTTALEYQHSPPSDPIRNAEFHMHIVEWSDMHFTIASIPSSQKHLLDEMVTGYGLRIADGLPAYVDRVGIHHFPFQSSMMYSFENTRDHPVYDNDPTTLEGLLQMEKAAVDAIIRNGKIGSA